MQVPVGGGGGWGANGAWGKKTTERDETGQSASLLFRRGGASVGGAAVTHKLSFLPTFVEGGGLLGCGGAGGDRGRLF